MRTGEVDGVKDKEAERRDSKRSNKGRRRTENLRIIKATCRLETLACGRKHTNKLVPRGYL